MDTPSGGYYQLLRDWRGVVMGEDYWVKSFADKLVETDWQDHDEGYEVKVRHLKGYPEKFRSILIRCKLTGVESGWYSSRIKEE